MFESADFSGQFVDLGFEELASAHLFGFAGLEGDLRELVFELVALSVQLQKALLNSFQGFLAFKGARVSGVLVGPVETVKPIKRPVLRGALFQGVAHRLVDSTALQLLLKLHHRWVILIVPVVVFVFLLLWFTRVWKNRALRAHHSLTGFDGARLLLYDRVAGDWVEHLAGMVGLRRPGQWVGSADA